MKVLIIGYGSIGKRHFEILKELKGVSSIDLVTKQNIPDITCIKNISDVINITVYDYFIISSETVKHYEQLKYICKKVNNKKILVEKPLYNHVNKDIKTNNKIITAYNLRFHPILKKLKQILKNEQIYYANVICGQYLPTWRPNTDYRQSYSADIKQGGGVLRDLSHELDYIDWLFGSIGKIDSISTKISELEINSDDIFTAIAITENKTIINLTIDYISKNPIRRLIVHTSGNTIEADMINSTLVIYYKNGNKENIEVEQKDRNYTYAEMHKSIIKNDLDEMCSFEEGKKIVDIIENIKYEEL